MPATVKKSNLKRMHETTKWRCVMPATVKKSSKKIQKSFQRMITPDEMLREMKVICQTKNSEDAFFREIGINMSSSSRTKKKRKVEAL